MTQTGLVALVIVAICAVAAAAKGKSTTAIATRQKALMTKREQGMYWRLREVFPDAVLLAQVAFSDGTGALLFGSDSGARVDAVRHSEDWNAAQA